MAYNFGDRKWPGLSKVLEECGEVSQVLAKLVGSNGNLDYFGKGSLEDKIVEELGDLHAAITWFIQHNDISAKKVARRSQEKQAKYTKWHNGGR